jgi:putative transposase
MKQIYKSYKFKLLPNEEQKILLNKHFGSVRFIYNHFLYQKQQQYLETKKSDGYNKQASILTEMKKKDEYEWLKEINSQTLQYNLQQLDDSFKRFFKGKSKFPKFKRRKGKNSFTVPQFVSIVNNHLKIPKFKNGVKLIQHREINGIIKRATLSKTPTNEYFVSILVEENYQPFEKTGAVVGIDLGLKDFIVTSDGVRYKNKKHFNKYQRKLKKAQQHLSRKQKDSKRFEKQRLKVAKIYKKTTNTRLDLLHKISHDLVKNNDIICIEDLNIKGMIKNPKLSKHIQDASWGEFIKQLKYKAEWNDKEIVTIDRFYPSSKTCNHCGYVKNDLNLSERSWTCKNGHVLDRDLNASINILNEGLRKINLSDGTSDYTNGDSNKTSVKKHKSKKLEA